MDLKWRPQNLPLIQASLPLSCSSVSLLSYRWELGGLFWILQYVPSTVVPHHPSVPPLTPVTVLLCCCHRECFLYEKKYFFSVSSSRLIPQILQTCLHWHKYNPLFFVVSFRSQVRYTYTKKTNQRKVLTCYSFLPEREKVEPDADSYIPTLIFAISFIC